MDEYMKAAINEAERSYEEGGIPIGAVLVHDGAIIGKFLIDRPNLPYY